jgi:hypothetical protein
LGYDPAGHPEWAKILRDEEKTCFQEKSDKLESKGGLSLGEAITLLKEIFSPIK